MILSMFVAFSLLRSYPLVIGAAALIPLVILCILLIFTRWRASRREETYQQGDPALAIDTHKQLVIRGDPGSGKTTLMKYLAVTCARALRNNKRQGDARDSVKKQLLWTTRPFPILITLHRYSNVAHWADNKRLIDVYSEEMSAELGKPCPEGFFERKLAKGNCLILFDAFDELGSPKARATMARRVGNFLHSYDVEDTGQPAPKDWIIGAYPTEEATYPVTGITVRDAKNYCKWLSQKTGETYRLPTEREWEWAATGTQRWRYPWGEQFDMDKCNTKGTAIGETTPVGSYLIGTNQYIPTDMIGNVWEITQGYSPLTLIPILGVISSLVLGVATGLIQGGLIGVAGILLGELSGAILVFPIVSLMIRKRVLFTGGAK